MRHLVIVVCLLFFASCGPQPAQRRPVAIPLTIETKYVNIAIGKTTFEDLIRDAGNPIAVEVSGDVTYLAFDTNSPLRFYTISLTTKDKQTMTFRRPAFQVAVMKNIVVRYLD
jgi:hypothetical protein